MIDILTSKSNQRIQEPKYICDQNCEKFPLLVVEIWCSHHKVFGAHIQTHRLTHGQTHPKTDCLGTIKVFGGVDIKMDDESCDAEDHDKAH